MTAAKAKPGGLNYGSIGNGSLGHLTMTLISQQFGVTFTHVPYRAVAGHW